MLQKNLKNRHFSSQNIKFNNSIDSSTYLTQKKNTLISSQNNLFESSPSKISCSKSPTSVLRKSKENPAILRLDHKSLSTLNFYDFQQKTQIIVLNDCKLKELPQNFVNFSTLKQLSLDSNHFSKIPTFLIENLSLETFSINHNLLEILPEKYGKWSDSLLSFDFSFNQIDRLDQNLTELALLRRLCINNNNFIKIPTSFYAFTFLEEFALDWFKYTFPSNFFLISGDLLKKFLRFCEVLFDKSKLSFNFLEFLEVFSNKKIELWKLFAKKRNILHRAAFENDVGVLRSSIPLLPNLVNELDSENYTALFLSILEENFNATKILLYSGADPSMGVGMLGGCIHLAVVKKEVFLLQDLLRKGGDPNAFDQQGNTPLHLLFSTFSNNMHKGEKIAKILLEFNANPQVKNKELWTCLHLAVKAEQVEALKWAIQYNKNEGKEVFNMDKAGGEIEMTLLHLAGCQGNREIMSILLDYGCDYLICDSLDRLPKNLCVNDQFLIKLIKTKEKKDIRRNIISKQKKNIKILDNLIIKIDEENDNEESHHKINLPTAIHSNKITLFSGKSKYFTNQNNINAKLFEENLLNDEDFGCDLDEFNDRKHKSIRSILKSPNNIVKIEQYQNARTCFFRKSCGDSINILHSKLFSRTEKKFTLKSFSFQNLENIINSLNEINDKIKEQMNRNSLDIKEDELGYYNIIINLQRKQIQSLAQFHSEINLLNSLFKEDPKSWAENRKEFDKVTNSLNKEELAQTSCNILLINTLFKNITKNELIDKVMICLLIIKNISSLYVWSFRDALKQFMQRNNRLDIKINKIIVCEIYHLLNFYKKKND